MVNWQQADLDAHYARLHGEVPATTHPVKIPKPRMNKLEREFAKRLELKKSLGLIKSYEFEGISLLLAPSTWYTPDFYVVNVDHSQVFYETKGFMREAARVRLNVAAAKFTEFKFYLVRKERVADGGEFDVRLVGGEE